MKTGLVLEGGAMRGMFTSGILDVFLENNIDFDGIAAVSAGATFGCNFKSRQIGRAIRYNKRYSRNPAYCSILSLLVTGDLYGAKFCYETLPEKLDIFDTKTFAGNPMDFYVVCTDMDTGKAVYHNCKTGDARDLRWIRASASMPAVSRPVRISGMKLSDGGTAVSVPLSYMEKKGFEKNVVILTQPDSFRKERQKHFELIRFALRHYPALVQALETRPERYNQNIEYVRQREREGAAFVIRPDESLNIGRTEKDPDELERVYQTGREKGLRVLPELRQFIRDQS